MGATQVLKRGFPSSQTSIVKRGTRIAYAAISAYLQINIYFEDETTLTNMPLAWTNLFKNSISMSSYFHFN